MPNKNKDAVRNRKRHLVGKASLKNDEEITDISSSDELETFKNASEVEDAFDSDEEFGSENPADKRRRLAKQYLENLKADANDIVQNDQGLLGQDEGAKNGYNYNNFDARDLDNDIIACRLKQDVSEQYGRVYRWISQKLLLSKAKVTFTRVSDKYLTCMSCYQPPLNKFSDFDQNKSKGRIFVYTVSKDMQLTKYEITDFNARPRRMKYARGGRRYIPESKQESENTTEGHCSEILTVASSPDGKYVVTGGRDRKLIIWSTESLVPIKVIPTKNRKGEVLALAFRKSSNQLYASCADYKIRIYDISQLSQLEVLYGHQDIVPDVSALSMERCITVGSRDRTAMLWKISDETRLIFRGGDDPKRLLKKWLKENPDTDTETPLFYGEGSIDCVAMIDDFHFVTGSDNGNIALWSLSKKKPTFIHRAAHGIIPLPKASSISAECDPNLSNQQLQGNSLTQPYWITSLYAIPYSNVFISGSWSGTLKVWELAQNMREFSLLSELPNCKGLVTKIQAVELGNHGRETFRILASVSKEHRLGRWIKNIPNARNGIYSAVVKQTEP